MEAPVSGHPREAEKLSATGAEFKLGFVKAAVRRAQSAYESVPGRASLAQRALTVTSVYIVEVGTSACVTVCFQAKQSMYTCKLRVIKPTTYCKKMSVLLSNMTFVIKLS